MLRIGITGGIGSGKSIVSRLFQALGVPTYDADTRARWLMENDAELRQQLSAAFGPDTYDATGRLNRPVLAGTVFRSPALLAQLNALVHPHVGTDFERWAMAQQQAGHAYVLKEAALLFEAGSYKQLDRIITVYAPLAVRAARVLRRDPHRSATDVEAIMGKQLSEEEKVARADYVLTNDDVQPLLPQVLALHAAFSAAPPA
ncbi:dephospho-CoA kinase [Hymenobacter sp. BT770]|uniref:dephospho-CoA kinase n=1 Tax=Hymenobacter sp. BT770 TaxID=2886942 RepID=UPI001D116FFE|nr:dephospho-CoA kinase [Hymenobacter sp. BT770]MCC3153357.1 dephospho-CoA kinase [Hymenobacter sp. BT770]MDO3415561.1 dephospho-CoA kinase [Hymenobacter sp. BT770]